MPAQLASSEQPKKSRGKRGGASNRKKALEKANKAAEAANEAAVKEALDAVKHNKDVLVTVASSTTNTTTATATAADGVLGSLGKKKRGRRGGAKNNSKKDFNADEAGDGETHEAAPTSAVTGNNNNNNNNNIIDPVVGVQTHRLPQLAPDVRDYFMVLESKLDLNSAAADHEADKGHEEEEEDQETKDLFVQNLFRELQNKELAMAGDFDGSRILEKLLPLSTDHQLIVFAANLLMNQDCSSLFRHQFASHVVQSLLYLASDIIHREQTGQSQIVINEDGEGDLLEDGSKLPTMSEIINKLCEELKLEWVSMMSDQYASHLLRVLLNLLAGKDMASNEKLRSKKSQGFKQRNSAAVIVQHQQHHNHTSDSYKRQVPENFKDTLQSISDSIFQCLSNIRQLQQLAIHPVANPVLQLLVALNGPTANALISLLLGEENTETSSFSSRSSNDRQVTSFFTIMIKDRVGSHLVEKILSVASDEDLEKLFTRYFESRMMDLCLDPVANFVVAALVTRCAGKSSPSTNSGTSTYLGHIVKELRPHLARLLFNNRGGLVEKLVAACGCSFTASTTAADDNVRNELVDALWVALEVTPAQMAEYAASIDQQDATSPATTLPPPPPPVISCLVTNRESKYILASPPNYSRSISMHGCLIAQHLLTHYSYSHIEPLITSLRALSPDTLVTFLTHPALSRVIEAVYTASSVPFESKWAITTAVAGKFCLLAKDKYGCHFVDKCWAVADVKLKQSIAQELAAERGSLESSFYGAIVLRNCRIDSFTRKSGDWLQKEASMERKRKMFQDILPQETMPIASISAGKKIKFEEVDSCPKPSLKPASADGGLNDVLIALKTSKKHKSKK